MCTVVIRVPDGPGPVRVLAVRDEDPHRPWRPLGPWWSRQPQVRGIMDELAGGAWLAVDDSKVAVLLNRMGGSDVVPPASRGTLVMRAMSREPLPDPLTTLGFNLVEATAYGARVTSWEGGEPRVVELTPGTHMIAHDDVDDPTTPRVAAWLDAFAAAPTDGERWWQGWLDVVAASAAQDPTHDRAIVRDKRPHGFPTLSLLVCAVSLGPEGTDARMATLDHPGAWNDLELG